MRLTRIDIKGFKSFAMETILHFNEQVVGVVGPNGSGKSNIVDAIRWVLGEQKSSELRLDKMSDVLFNGTKKRKASGLASVAITFENDRSLIASEYHSITIARTLFRTGESQYQINGVTCRLKDIHNILQDTGIGSNTYAIIALGMVDDILQDKDQSRRRMFEQSAGISKYKKRKHETMLKLKNTEADLDRVEDLLYEIEQNLKTLERQAKRTQRYFDLKQDYKILSIQLTHIRSKALRASYESLAGKITAQEDKLREEQIAETNLTAKLEQIKKDHLDQEVSVSTLQRSLNQIVHQIRTAENQKKLDEQQLEFKTQNVERLTQQVNVHRERAIQLEESAGSIQSRIAQASAQSGELSQSLQAAEQNKNEVFEAYGTAKEDVDQLKQQFQVKERQVFELEKKIAVDENQLGLLTNQLEQYQTQRTYKVQQLEQYQKDDEELKVVLDNRSLALKEARDLESKLKAQVTQLKESKEKVRDELQKVLRSLDAKGNEFDLLKSLVENFEGFPESIQFLHKAKQWVQKSPLLSDIIYCEEKYRVIVEQYLDQYLNYFIVPHKTDALQAIHLLADSQKGKANFFILDAFQQTEPVAAHHPGMTPVWKQIEVDTQYQSLLYHLFDQVYFLESGYEDYLHDPAYAHFTFLSTDGKIVSRKQHVLTGGSIGLFEGKKIGRKKNLEKLQKTIQKLQTEKSDLEYQLARFEAEIKHTDTSEATQDIQDLEKELQQYQHRKVQLDARLNNEKEQVAQIDQNMDSAQLRIQQIRDQQGSDQQQLNLLKAAIQEANQALAERGDAYEKLVEVYNQKLQAYNERRIEFIQQDNTVKTLQSQMEFNATQWRELQQEIESKTNQIHADQVEISRLRVQIEEAEAHLVEAYGDKKLQESDLSGVEEDYFKVRGEIHELEEEIKIRNRNYQQANQLLNELKEKRTDLKYQLNGLFDRLRIEFNVTEVELQSVELEESGMPSLDELDEKVQNMKKRLEGFGEINPMAVEAYNEMKERYDHIFVQRADILEARDSLMDTIQEIETTATNQFLDAFNLVRENFINVFRSLFSEDDACDLILTDPENPLESGIEIIAKPKGKRPLTLNQLSGGEKTLTAIALLFAMYLLKPAPFCIFDEVDAPLDDSNVEKFNRIIKNFSEQSQFIIVTHNKLTMAAMDVIYGVYMEEQGVSNVSAVDFRAYDHLSLLEVQN
ncbi:MAG: chromosome segregation protein SMC [Saprospiraceae bacterium]